LVDSSLVDLRGVGDDARYRIFDYYGRGMLGALTSGIDPTYVNKIRNRRARVSDSLLEGALSPQDLGHDPRACDP
jgi:hypothetical protein